jgi:hypothetical protein
VVLHIRSADGSTPRLLVRAVVGDLTRVRRIPARAPGPLRLNAHVEVPVPLHRDRARARECFDITVRGARSEPHP